MFRLALSDEADSRKNTFNSQSIYLVVNVAECTSLQQFKPVVQHFNLQEC